MPIPDKVTEAIAEIYQSGYDDGYAAARAEFDSALVDAQRAGYEVGRQEVYQVLIDKLPNDTRVRIIEDLEEALDLSHWRNHV